MSPKLSVFKLLICATNVLIFVSAKPTPNGYNYDQVGNYVSLENTYMTKPGYHYNANYQPQSFQGLFGQDGPIPSLHHGKPLNFVKLYENPNYPSFQTIFLIRSPPLQQFPDQTSHITTYDGVEPEPHLSQGFALPDPNGMIVSEPTLSNPNVFTLPEVRMPSVEMTPPKMEVPVSTQERTETPEAPKIPELSEQPQVPQIAETSEVPQLSVLPDVSVVPQVPVVTEVPEIPAVSEIPEQRTEEQREPVQTSTTEQTVTTTTAGVDSSTSANTNVDNNNINETQDPFRPVSQDDAPVDDSITTQAPEDQDQETTEVSLKNE